MKNSQKFIFSFLIAAILLVFAATAALATNHISAPSPEPINLTNKLSTVGLNAGFDSSGDNSLPLIIGRVIQGFLSLLGVIFMGYIIYAGSLWITARGEEEKITKAKAIIRGSIIGIIIVFSAYAITSFVIYNLVIGSGFGENISS